MHDLEYERTATSLDEEDAPWRPLVMLLFVACAYLAGLGVCVLFVAIRYRQWIGLQDASLVLCWTLAAFTLVALPIWIGVLSLTRTLISRRAIADRWRWILHLGLPPLVSALAVAAVLAMAGGSLRAFFSAEGLSLLASFCASGVVFGAGWHLTYGARRWTA